jgi:hypothetical protein
MSFDAIGFCLEENKMFKNKTIASALLMVAYMATFAYGQEKVGSQQILTITGKLSNVDFVGNTIIVKKDTEQVTLSVPANTVITRGGEKLGIGDLEEADSVTVQYYNPSSGQYIATSIIDNNVTGE